MLVHDPCVCSRPCLPGTSYQLFCTMLNSWWPKRNHEFFWFSCLVFCFLALFSFVADQLVSTTSQAAILACNLCCIATPAASHLGAPSSGGDAMVPEISPLYVDLCHAVFCPFEAQEAGYRFLCQAQEVWFHCGSRLTSVRYLMLAQAVVSKMLHT